MKDYFNDKKNALNQLERHDILWILDMHYLQENHKVIQYFCYSMSEHDFSYLP